LLLADFPLKNKPLLAVRAKQITKRKITSGHAPVARMLGPARPVVRYLYVPHPGQLYLVFVWLDHLDLGDVGSGHKTTTPTAHIKIQKPIRMQEIMTVIMLIIGQITTAT